MSKHAPTLNSSLRRTYASSFAPEGNVQPQVQPLNVSSSSVPTSSSVQASEKLYQKVLRNVRNAGRPTVFSTREATATATATAVSRGRSSTAAAATYLGLRRRDARDASGKRYRVQIPRRMLLSVVVVFLVLPACTFLYVVARDDHRREERSGRGRGRARTSANDDETTTTTTTTTPESDDDHNHNHNHNDHNNNNNHNNHNHNDHNHNNTVVRDETDSEPSINVTKHNDGLLHLLNETRTRNSTAATTDRSYDRPPERATPSSLDVVTTNDPEPNEENAATPQNERSKD